MESNKQKKNNPELEQFIDKKYQYGFITDIESETLPPGLDENVIRLISEKKNEPEFLLKWRLKAFKYFSIMHNQEPLNPV